MIYITIKCTRQIFSRRVRRMKKTLLSSLMIAGLLAGCGGGGSTGGGIGSAGSGGSTGGASGGGATKTLAGIVYSGSESFTTGQIQAQDLYTDGSTGAISTVATYCNAGNDHGLIANTKIKTGEIYLYSLCRNSGQIVGWGIPTGSSPSTNLTQVADFFQGSSFIPAQAAITLNGQYMFVAGENNTVVEFSVGTDGSLTSMGTVLSYSGSYGVYSIAISPSGNYLVLARASSSGNTYYLDEYLDSPRPSPGHFASRNKNLSIDSRDIGIARPDS